jgi:hypothetical protein
MEQQDRPIALPLEENPTDLPLGWRLAARFRGLRRLFSDVDDFDWSTYHVHYRSEVALNRRYWSENLSEVDFRVLDGRLYVLADSKPVHPMHRCVYEALINLPAVSSVAEIGTGGGRFIANLPLLLDPSVRYSAFDISEKQLEFFAAQYPERYAATNTAVLDLTVQPIPAEKRPDVVFASTVLMHIQRPAAYLKALEHFLASARSYAVLMDNYKSHDYFGDLTGRFGQFGYYCYDSGAGVAIVVDLARQGLGAPYAPLTRPEQLVRYYP